MKIDPLSSDPVIKQIALNHTVHFSDNDREICCMFIDISKRHFIWTNDVKSNNWITSSYKSGELYLKNIKTGFKTLLL